MPLLNRANSVLVIIDVQQRLAPAIHDVDNVMKRIAVLAQAAAMLEVPIVATEQYPAGLGQTLPEIRDLLPENAVAEKITFDAFGSGDFTRRLEPLHAAGRRHLVFCGMEAHVCVLQSAMSAAVHGFSASIVADAIGSRIELSRQTALQRLAGADVEPVTTEMVVFEWMERAGTEEFRQVSKLIR